MQLVALEVSGAFNASFFTAIGAAKNINGSPSLITGAFTYISGTEDTPNTHQILSIGVGGGGSGAYLSIEVKTNGGKSNFVAYVRYTQTLF